MNGSAAPLPGAALPAPLLAGHSRRSLLRRRIGRRQLLQAGLAAVAALTAPAIAPAMLTRPAQAATLAPRDALRQFGEPGDFIIATAADVSTLDPQMSTTAANIRVAFNLFDTLVTAGPDLTLQPSLATSWRLLDDRTWEFKLRPGVTFHNGDPLTSEDVRFTINRTFDPAARTAVATVFSTIVRIDTPDSLTVRFVTHEPDPLLPARLSFVGGQILPSAYFQRVGPDGFQAQPIGSGPIQYRAWVPNEFLLCSANRNYWGGAPDFDRVVFARMPRERDRVDALISGKAHIATRLTPEWRLRLSIRPEAKPASVLYSGLYVLCLNVNARPLDNRLVRQAMSLAIDRDTIWRGLWLGRGLIPIGFVPQGDRVGHAPDLPPFEYNQERARRLLQQAGYTGEPIIFEATDGYLDNDAAMSTVVVAMWQQVGINAEVRWITPDERTRLNQARGFSGVWWSDPTSTIHDPDGMLFRLIAPGGFQDYWYDDEWFQLGSAARVSQDPDVRDQHYRRMQEIMLEQLPWLPILQPEEGYGVRSDVQWQPSSTGRLELRRDGLRWDR